jgi:hypothetical protein
MAGCTPIIIANRRGVDRGLKWVQITLWTVLLTYWLAEKHLVQLGVCIAFLVLAFRHAKSAALKRITEVSLDDESLNIARKDGSSFSIPASRISYAAVHARRIDVAYLQSEEKLTQEFKRSDFDAPAWGGLQLLAARFPGG